MHLLDPFVCLFHSTRCFAGILSPSVMRHHGFALPRYVAHCPDPLTVLGTSKVNQYSTELQFSIPRDKVLMSFTGPGRSPAISRLVFGRVHRASPGRCCRQPYVDGLDSRSARALCQMTRLGSSVKSISSRRKRIKQPSQHGDRKGSPRRRVAATWLSHGAKASLLVLAPQRVRTITDYADLPGSLVGPKPQEQEIEGRFAAGPSAGDRCREPGPQRILPSRQDTHETSG
ncbi:hypothetical protein J2W42_003020 [Rhizobium tibeticum]|nr:hypothetical protein [Rhizobium tibeticum]